MGPGSEDKRRRASEKKLEKPQSRPHKAGGKGGARTLDLPPEQAQSVFHFSTPRRVGFDTQ